MARGFQVILRLGERAQWGRFAGSSLAPILAIAGILLASRANAFIAPKTPELPPSALIKIDVIGKDERTAVPPHHRKTAEAIGLLWQRGSGHACSAFCAGDSVIATNAHCIVRVGRRKSKNLQLFRFILAPEFGAVTADHVSTLLFAATEQPNLSFYTGNWRSSRSLDAMSQDWAFAKLAKPICRSKGLRFSGQSAQRLAPRSDIEAAYRKSTTPSQRRADRLFMIAYHGDRDLEQRWYSGNCQRQASKRSSLIFHTCDTFKGSSGAPILRMRNGEPEVVAINVGTYAHERYRYTRFRNRNGRLRRRRQVISKSIVNVGVKPNGFVAGLKRFQREALLSSLNEFRDMQVKLKDADYYTGKIDGIFGRRTRRAIVAFERRQGLAPIGMPTKRLLRDLRNDQPRYPNTPRAVPDRNRPGS